MKKLAALLFLATALVVPSVYAQQPIPSPVQQIISFSATPTFNVNQGSVFLMTLTGSVTSSTLLGGVPGQVATFLLTQDSSGSHTFAWPSNTNNGPTVIATGSATTTAVFIFDGGSWNAQISAAGNSTTVASGTSAMGTSAISSGTCATTVSTAATGVATTDSIQYTPNGDPQGVTGYTASASGSLYIWAFPTNGHVNFEVCNNTSGSITPAALTLNWRVVR